MLQIIYRLLTGIYFFGIKVYALFNQKAKTWIKGRKNWQSYLAKATEDWDGCVWFHCASLGEFEQGRPLIERFRKKHPQQKILLTFFSPSGYEIRKNYAFADYVHYLPTDTPKNAALFLDIVNPKLVVFVKYEWWYFFSKAMFERNIPFYSISCIFRKDQPFFKFYGILHREILSFYTHLFVQDRASKILLDGIQIKPVTLSGDTRFDRVLENKSKVKTIPFLEKFKTSKPILIGGSTYPKEDLILIELMQQPNFLADFKFIIVPHDIDYKYCQNLKHNIPLTTSLYSEIEETDSLIDVQVLIIDSIGLLNTCYAYVNYAFIGGGFSKGIHNILEPAVFGLPIFFGPQYHKAQEALELLEQQSAFSIQQVHQIQQIIEEFEMNNVLKQKNKIALENYFEQKAGATEIIITQIEMSS